MCGAAGSDEKNLVSVQELKTEISNNLVSVCVGQEVQKKKREIAKNLVEVATFNDVEE